MFCAQNRVIFFIICHFSMKWCVALCVFHDISQIFHDNGFLLVVLLACFFLCVFRLRFRLRFCLCFCLRVLEDNRDNGDNFLILNSMLSEDNNKYNFYQPEGWLPLENCCPCCLCCLPKTASELSSKTNKRVVVKKNYRFRWMVVPLTVSRFWLSSS